jgi:hypothetical protein
VPAAQRQEYDRRVSEAREYLLRVMLAVQTLLEPGSFQSRPEDIEEVANEPIYQAGSLG